MTELSIDDLLGKMEATPYTRANLDTAQAKRKYITCTRHLYHWGVLRSLSDFSTYTSAAKFLKNPTFAAHAQHKNNPAAFAAEFFSSITFAVNVYNGNFDG